MEDELFNGFIDSRLEWLWWQASRTPSVPSGEIERLPVGFFDGWPTDGSDRGGERIILRGSHSDGAQTEAKYQAFPNGDDWIKIDHFVDDDVHASLSLSLAWPEVRWERWFFQH